MDIYKKYLIIVDEYGFNFDNEEIFNEFKDLISLSIGDKPFYLFKGHSLNDFYDKYRNINDILTYRIYELLLSATNLYGFITISDFISLYNAYYEDDDITISDLDVAFDLDNNKTFTVRNDNISGFNYDLNDDEDYEELLVIEEMREDYPMFLPDIELMKKYADPFFFETSDTIRELANLIYQKKHSLLKYEEIEYHCFILARVIKTGMGVEAFSIFYDKVELENFDNEILLNVIAPLLLKIYNGQRKFDLCGCTPDEVLNDEDDIDEDYED